MTRFKSSVGLLILGFGVSACGGSEKGLTPEHNPTLYSMNQPVVQRTDYVLDLTTSGGGLPATEQARLAGWFDSLELGYGDRVFIDQAAGYADPAIHDNVASVAADYGLLLSEGAPMTVGAVQPGSVRVVVSRTIASVPNCPNWEKVPTGASDNTDQNYGCSINSNLAAMIGDPNDLVLGQSGNGPRDGAISTKAIDTYRKKAPTGAGGLKSESAGGK